MNAPVHFTHYPQHWPTHLFAAEERAEYGVKVAAEPDRTTEWNKVHERIVQLGAQRAAHERELCQWLLAAERLGVAARTGYSSLREYAEGISGSREGKPRKGSGSAVP